MSLENFEKTLTPEGLKVFHVPHNVLAGGAGRPCPIAAFAPALKEIKVCSNHVGQELLPFILQHERLESLYSRDPDEKRKAQDAIPIKTDDPHNLAYARVYKAAAAAGKLRLIHRELRAIKPSLEAKESTLFRNRLFRHYIGRRK